MKVALIPPTSLREYTLLTNYQLMLPQLLETDLTYAAHYKKLCDDPNQFVIMDNGAAEAEQPSFVDLLYKLIKFRPQEFAIPDVLGDADATINLCNKFFDECEDELIRLQTGLPDGLQLGFVAQGKDPKEALRTVKAIIHGPWAPYIDTVYIPRLLVKKDDVWARIRIAQEIDELYGNRLAIHLFGASPLWCSELHEAARYAPFIRGIDSSMPFNYAHAGSHLSDGYHHKRPDHYFHFARSLFNPYLATSNVKTYISWAEGNSAEAPTSKV